MVRLQEAVNRQLNVQFSRDLESFLDNKKCEAPPLDENKELT